MLAARGIEAEHVIGELVNVGFSRIGRLYDGRGNLQHPQKLPDHVEATIASVKTLKTNVVSGDGHQEETREVKLWDKMSALNTLAKHFGLVTDKHDVTLHATEELLTILNRRKEQNRARNAE